MDLLFPAYSTNVRLDCGVWRPGQHLELFSNTSSFCGVVGNTVLLKEATVFGKTTFSQVICVTSETSEV